MKPRTPGRHRVTPRPALTADRLVAVFHDALWRHVDDGRSIEDAAELARMDMLDRRPLVVTA